MTYTEEELKIAQEWDDTAKFRSDIHSDIYSFIEGMRYQKKESKSKEQILDEVVGKHSNL